MLLFFIYAALGVELFGRLGEWGAGWRSLTHKDAVFRQLRVLATPRQGPPLPQPLTARGERDSGHMQELLRTRRSVVTGP